MSRTNFFDFQEQLASPRRATAPATPTASAAPEADALTVSALTRQIEGALRAGLPPIVSVKGEVSNYNHHRGSGHIYFTLKDDKACIDCVMFRSEAARLKFVPEDGMELLATGSIRVYAQRGRYQLYVSTLHPLGQGALELAFQQLRAKLEKERLFEDDRKKPLPAYPLRIALVTSRQTAALQDMLKVLRNFPWVRLSLVHVPVQGDGAAAKIAEALTAIGAARRKCPIDLILLARGGGSLEDLWAFNEEVVARAMAKCPIPIITGVGHEVDVSIADLVADYHAHTPTEAAQVAVAQWRTARDVIDTSVVRLRRSLRQVLQDARQRLAAVERHELFRRPFDRVNALRQLLDDRQRSLTLAVSHRLRRNGERLARVEALLEKCHPQHQLQLHGQKLSGLTVRFTRAVRTNQQAFHLRLDALQRHLNAVGPQQVLRRGYSITTLKRGGAIVRSSSQLKPGERIVTRFADGTVESTVDDSKQMSLFE